MPDDTQVNRAQSEREQDIRKLRDKIGELRAAEGVKRAAADAFVDECKRSGLDPITGTTDADKESFNRIDTAYKEADRLAEQAVDFEHRLERIVITTGHEADAHAKGDVDHPAMRRAFSMAENFMASEDYRQLQRTGALQMQGARVSTAAVTVASREALLAAMFPTYAAALTVDALVPEDTRLFPPVPIPVRPLRVRDLVTVGTTDTDTVEYVEETTRTDAAAETPYGTSAPEASYGYTLRSVGVKRIPHHVKATKGNLADAGQLRTLLDNRLIYGVGKRLDTQMIAGDAVGDNIRGILETVGLQSVNGTNESVPDAFHRGLTAVRLSLEDEPDAFLLHPDVYEEFVLAKGNDGHYVNLQGPQLNTPPNVWGKSAVVNTVCPTTSALVGNWKMGATLWLRSGIQVAATDSDQADFLKGIITILAEMRAAFAVTQVKAFAEIVNIGATST